MVTYLNHHSIDNQYDILLNIGVVERINNIVQMNFNDNQIRLMHLTLVKCYYQENIEKQS